MSSLGLHIGLGASKVLAGHVGGVENRYGHRAATPDSGSDDSFKCSQRLTRTTGPVSGSGVTRWSAQLIMPGVVSLDTEFAFGYQLQKPQQKQLAPLPLLCAYGEHASLDTQGSELLPEKSVVSFK